MESTGGLVGDPDGGPIRALRPDDRVLALGASGWFGRTLLDLVGSAVPLLATASSARGPYIAWDLPTIERFAPTVVANFAFLTRDRIQDYGPARYEAINSSLTARFGQAARLPSVRAVLTVSSGAAVTEPESLYGRLKLAEEQAALALATPARAVCVARAYAVTGGHVRRPELYAFSDFILQAASGTIRVRADRPTWRRYAAVSDVLAVCLDEALGGRTGMVETGGPLIEMGALARMVADEVNAEARVERAPMCSDEASVYASDDTQWQAACARAEVRPMELREQIRATAAMLG